MSVIYIVGPAGDLMGPATLPVVPGVGRQMPDDAIELAAALGVPADGFAWALVDGIAQQLEDHRGTVYRTDSGVELQHARLGALPPDLTAIPKPSPTHEWQNGSWGQGLPYLHEHQVSIINSACMEAITGGFWSSALGSPHQYTSEIEDQLNLTGVIALGADSVYPCRDEQGSKAFRLHTFKQLRQVGDDSTMFKLRLLQKANQLKEQLDSALAAGDRASIEAVSWKDLQP